MLDRKKNPSDQVFYVSGPFAFLHTLTSLNFQQEENRSLPPQPLVMSSSNF